MDLRNRISLMQNLGTYMLSQNGEWAEARSRAFAHNPWFTPDFVDLAIRRLVAQFLQAEKLEAWAAPYHFPATQGSPKTVGLVMAGNIPLVGFHDLLCIFVSGHRQMIKASSKDQQLLPVLLQYLARTAPESIPYFQLAPILKGCDAYIATGSNNTARYFDYYFAKYPSLIRRNRTSVAVLRGDETPAELDSLADDIHEYFGLGCRNVTKIFVPENYDFLPLLGALRKYHWLADHHRYKNNYDYQLSLAILNRQEYMTNESVLLMPAASPFSPISVLHYSVSADPEADLFRNTLPEQIQGVVGRGFIPFGKSQQPGLADYADGADTLQFLRDL